MGIRVDRHRNRSHSLPISGAIVVTDSTRANNPAANNGHTDYFYASHLRPGNLGTFGTYGAIDLRTHHLRPNRFSAHHFRAHHHRANAGAD